MFNIHFIYNSQSKQQDEQIMPKRQPDQAFLKAQNLLALALREQTISCRHLEECLRIEPKNGNALFFYSICLKERGLEEKSKEIKRRAYSLNPCYYETLGDEKEQIKNSILHSLNDIIKGNSLSNDFKWQETVNMLAKKKDLNTCSLIISLFENVKKENRSYSPHLFSTFGITLYEIGSYQKSLEKYELACSLKQNEYRYYNNMAILQYIFGRYQESTNLVAKSLIHNPGYPKSMFILSFSLCKLGRQQEALEHALNSAKKEPTMTMYRFKVLTILLQHFPGKIEEFETQLKQTQRIIANNQDSDSYFYSKQNQKTLKSSAEFLRECYPFRNVCEEEWAKYIQHLDDYLVKGHTDKYCLSLKMKEITLQIKSLVSQFQSSENSSLNFYQQQKTQSESSQSVVPEQRNERNENS